MIWLLSSMLKYPGKKEIILSINTQMCLICFEMFFIHQHLAFNMLNMYMNQMKSIIYALWIQVKACITFCEKNRANLKSLQLWNQMTNIYFYPTLNLFFYSTADENGSNVTSTRNTLGKMNCSLTDLSNQETLHIKSNYFVIG